MTAQHFPLKSVILTDRHKPTGMTSHYLGAEKLSAPYSLIITKYPNDDGVYLMYLDREGKEVTDTFHDTVEEAMEQAKFEFGVQVTEWNDL
jgi:hypothetical protein